ncbi:MAG: HNH endonuclease family protein, partial [Chloroflexota bacterium]|nr:HNH endonuclease family protein [Chloroflexota bacterium]
MHVHRLGNLTITGCNSNLGNKSFDEKSAGSTPRAATSDTG